MKLDKTRKYGEIWGEAPVRGARYVQDGAYFAADGTALGVPAPAVVPPPAAVEPTPAPEPEIEPAKPVTKRKTKAKADVSLEDELMQLAK